MSLTVFIVRNGISNPSLNPGQGCLHFPLHGDKFLKNTTYRYIRSILTMVSKDKFRG